jgi:hypothetical protein
VIHLFNSGSYEGLQDSQILSRWNYQVVLDALMFAACSVPYEMFREELSGVWPFLPEVCISSLITSLVLANQLFLRLTTAHRHLDALSGTSSSRRSRRRLHSRLHQNLRPV